MDIRTLAQRKYKDIDWDVLKALTEKRDRVSEDKGSDGHAAQDAAKILGMQYVYAAATSGVSLASWGDKYGNSRFRIELS